MVLALSFFASACSGDSSSDPSSHTVSEESQEQEQPSKLEEVFPIDEWENVASPSPVELCKVPDGLPADEIGYGLVRGSVGFPFIADRFPHNGVASIVLAQVAFEDVRPAVAETPLEYFTPHAQKLEEWALFLSQGQFEIDAQIVPEFVEMPMKSSDLPNDERAVADLILQRMPSDIDFEEVDGVFVFWANEMNSRLGGDGALRVGSNEYQYGDGEERPALFWAPHNWHLQSTPGTDYEHKRKYTWGYLVHEIHHEQGLNTHAPGNGWRTGSGQNQYPDQRTGQWSAVLASWELWLLGWIADTQVQCVTPSDLTEPQQFVLTPQEIYGGERKIAVIPIDDSDVLVVESRRPINWTQGWEETDAGLFVYTVNPQLREQDDHDPNDCGNSPEYPKWAYYLFPDGLEPRTCYFNGFQQALLRKAGQTVTHKGVRISLEHVGEELDYVMISAE
jgi:hypothetical protein